MYFHLPKINKFFINSLLMLNFTDVKTSSMTNTQEYEPQINPFSSIH